MLYPKPKNVRYVDMCIYIDSTFYTEDRNDELTFEYLYHLCRMLATKFKYFKKSWDYDEFSMFAAKRAYFRLINQNRPPIKSIKNYLNFTIPKMKIDFDEEEHSSPPPIEMTDRYEYGNFDSLFSLSESLVRKFEFEANIDDIKCVCHKFFKHLPRKKYSYEWRNIEISVLLTFLDSMNLSEYEKKQQKLWEEKGVPDKKEWVIDTSIDHAVLFHLDQSWENYIIVLARRLQAIVVKELMINSKVLV